MITIRSAGSNFENSGDYSKSSELKSLTLKIQHKWVRYYSNYKINTENIGLTVFTIHRISTLNYYLLFQLC